MVLAGQPIRALDLGEPKYVVESADETGFTSTTYIAGAVTVGQAFTAPTSGRVLVLWHARFESNTNNARSSVTVEVRTGDTLGAGTVVSAATDNNALETDQSANAAATNGFETRTQAGMWRVVDGLTAGSAYNAVMLHRMQSAGNGDVMERSLAVIPLA